MSSDSYSETTTRSFGSRITGAIMGLILSPIALLGGCGLLFWNEGNAVHTAQSLDEGEKQVVSIAADKIDPVNLGKLVYVTGETAVTETLKDPELGVTATEIKLARVVEMFQWVENKQTRRKNNRETTTYNYAQKWTDSPVSSQGFYKSGHDNPGFMPLHSHQEIASRVTLGAFTLSDLQIAQTDIPDNRQPRIITAEEFAAMPEEVRRDAEQRDGELYLPVARWLPNAPKDRLNSKFAVTPNQEPGPQIGDVRVKFQVVKPGPTTIVAMQTATGFEPFPTKAGKTVHLFRTQALTSPQMFELARADNNMWAWILRGIGLGVLFAGFMLLMGPLSAISEWIPFLGSLVSVGLFVFAIAGTLLTGSVIISAAWLFYRPILAIGLLLVSVALAFGLWYLFRRRKPEPLSHSSGLEIVS